MHFVHIKNPSAVDNRKEQTELETPPWQNCKTRKATHTHTQRMVLIHTHTMGYIASATEVMNSRDGDWSMYEEIHAH